MLRFTAFNFASSPTTYLAKETTTASLRPQSFIRWQRRLHLHPLWSLLGSCTCMARGGCLSNDMVVWMGKWQKEEEKSGLSRRVFTSEQEPDVLKQDGCTRASYGCRPRFLRSLRLQFARRNGAVGLYLMAHISAMPGFNQVEISVGSCNGMSICEVVKCV